MHVVFISSEVFPYSSTGPLGELAGDLPQALRRQDVKITVITPFYKQIDPQRWGIARRIRRVDVKVGGDMARVGLLDGKFPSADVPVIFVDHEPSFGRAGIYGEDGEDYPDNAHRFYLFCSAALRIIEELELAPDLLHLNDWQTGFVPMLQRAGGQPACPVVFSVHDPAFAGLFPPHVLDELALGRDLFHPEGVEFHGQVSLLKAGLLYSRLVNTFSPSLARELTRQDQGFGLHGLYELLGSRLVGILPGMAPELWNPAADHRLAANFSAEVLTGKAACKEALQKELGLSPRADLPLFFMPGPLADGGAMEAVLRGLAQLTPESFQVIFAGQPVPGTTDRMQEMAGHSPAFASFIPEPEGDRLHRLLAGADAALLPRRHEPGGTLQLRAMRYGAVPVCHAVGGLKDTVVNYDQFTRTGTGIHFDALDEGALSMALHRAVHLLGNTAHRETLVQNGMRHPFTWDHSAELFKQLYERALG